MEFKVGDKVTLRDDSQYNEDHRSDRYQLKKKIGTIIKIYGDHDPDDSTHRYEVSWTYMSMERSNGYRHKDLQMIMPTFFNALKKKK